VHGLVCHGAQINHESEPAGVKLRQIHVLGFVFLFHKEAFGLFPHVFPFDAIVVKHARHAVDCDFHFRQIREDIFF